MPETTAVLSFEQFVFDFLPVCESLSAEPFYNAFGRVPGRRDICNHLTETINASSLLSDMKFIMGHRNEVACGLYPSDYTPHQQHKIMNWATIELLVECSHGQDPFDDSPVNQQALDMLLSSVGQIFKYQHRQFVFVVLFVEDYARVVRFDRAGTFASERISYTIEEQGVALTQFIIRFSSLEPSHRGHDPTAIRIHYHDKLSTCLREHGASLSVATTSLDDDISTRQAPPDHVIKLFNDSLDDEWPWWKLAVPNQDGRTCWFAVGKPHFYAGGVAGRGTRGYVAVPLDAEGKEIDTTVYYFVYLKDAWRIQDGGVEREGDILSALNANSVRFVPTLVCHNDLPGQITQSYNDPSEPENEGEEDSAHAFGSYQHYRLVVKEIGKPLSEFQSGYELVFAIFCCIVGHKDACLKAGYIHGDISAGNILLYPNKSGTWAGLLNDWELSKRWKDGKTEMHAQQLDRMGTWQFMSVNKLLYAKGAITISDELESFFHVLLYYALRFLPHDIPPEHVGKVLYDYFDDYSEGVHGLTCGALKHASIRRGILDVRRIVKDYDSCQVTFLAPSSGHDAGRADEVVEKGSTRAARRKARAKAKAKAAPRRHIIDELISAWLLFFRVLYAKIEYASRPKILPVDYNVNNGGMPESLAAEFAEFLNRPKRNRVRVSEDAPPDFSLAEVVESHDPLLDVIGQFVLCRRGEWPTDDKGQDKKPKVETTARTVTHSSPTFSGKRRIDDQVSPPPSKRRRYS